MQLERRVHPHYSPSGMDSRMPTGAELVDGIQRQFEKIIKPDLDRSDRERVKRLDNLDNRRY